ncbi:alcohol dehydrogenase [Coniochaeta ligniaria NRRL 30616]|uniref:Alcohol dehydrogenase n=1 Tax=Coniochaeta ligniaria NRRL 30616 TaxID=1408157 RepID=A0A1J7ID24_9PEZI|nr:alcohol dehydrogenase [Coniochaeta ligniaria NRRL 30616]
MTRAWTFTHGGFPTALQQTTLPPDSTPLKPTEIWVQTKAASVNPVDAQMMGFPLWPYLPSFILPSHKGVGEDFAGVVTEAGRNTGFKTGDEVFGIGPFLPGGTLQETIRLDTKHSVVVPKPVDWSWEQAAALPLVWITAQTTIHLVIPYVKHGKIAVLGGSSSCGMYAVYIAKQRGWEVIASCSGRNADFVRSMGADEVVDYTTTSVPERVRAFAPDAIIDVVGGTECLGIAKRYVTVVGDKTNRMTMGGRNIYFWNPQMLLRALAGRISLGSSYTCVNLDCKRSYLEEVLRLPKEKIIIDSTFDFDHVREAFDKLNTSRTRGKVVIKIST